ncbi:MAG: hypothetical protein IJ876_04020 [Elusimicrobiaceae bacterium]|nr:hypothetical protein [Elusimicrobiaceae bacterium]
MDALELLNKTPITHEHPYEVLSRHIDTYHLQYGKLLALAERYYPRHTLIWLARTASKGGYIL